MSNNKLTEKFTFEEIRINFSYDHSTGEVINKKTGGLGYINQHGHVAFRLNKKHIYAHHIAWWLYYGSAPDIIDHKDMNPRNNKIENLRLADKKYNSCNRGVRSDNTSGYKGVSYSKSKGKWRAYCDSKHIGYYPDAKSAAVAYNKVATVKHGEFARLNLVRSED